jgi:hypothetical protein
MSDNEDILITGEELYHMTMHYRRKPEKSMEGKCAEWHHWFEKRYEKIFKDAAARGEFSVTLPAPYTPADKSEQGPLRHLRNKLRRQLPGCVVEFIEEECDEKILYFIEIAWDEAVSSASD